MIIKPKPLKKGDTIAIIAPSAGLAAIFPHRLDNAVKFLTSQGYKVKEFPLTRKINGWESAPAEERAKEIMDAFLDNNISAIICEIGGTTLNKTLKYLDFDKIKENPKIFCGYSDITILHYALNKKSNLMTFYGPCAMTQFGEYPKPLEHTLEYFNKAIVKNKIGIIKPSKEWTEEVLDWGSKKDLERPRKLIKNERFVWLKKGNAKGQIIGGCLHSICQLLKSEYWPEHKNKILFIETPEGQEFNKGEPLSYVDAQLADLEIAGIFNEIAGLIVGRPFKYDDEEYNKFKELIVEVTKKHNIPVLFGADIGHTDPQITIPLGAEVELNSEKDLFRLDA